MARRITAQYFLVVARNDDGDIVREAYLLDRLFPPVEFSPSHRMQTGTVKLVMQGLAWADEIAFPRMKGIVDVSVVDIIDVTYRTPVSNLPPSAILVYDVKIMSGGMRTPYKGK